MNCVKYPFISERCTKYPFSFCIYGVRGLSSLQAGAFGYLGSFWIRGVTGIFNQLLHSYTMTIINFWSFSFPICSWTVISQYLFTLMQGRLEDIPTIPSPQQRKDGQSSMEMSSKVQEHTTLYFYSYPLLYLAGHIALVRSDSILIITRAISQH